MQKLKAIQFLDHIKLMCCVLLPKNFETKMISIAILTLDNIAISMQTLLSAQDRINISIYSYNHYCYFC